MLVNNAAATGAYGEVAVSADLDSAVAQMNVTLFGTWRLTQELVPLLRKSEAPRIVNVSSGAGSHGDLAFGLTSGNGMGPGYAISKAALNALTTLLATELKDAGVLVNAVCPGFTATFPDMSEMGARPPRESAAGVVWAATLDASGPTGGFFRDRKTLPW